MQNEPESFAPMTPLATIHSCLLALAMLFLPSQVFAQTTKSSWQEDWGKIFGGGAKRRQGYRIDPCERVEIFTARGNAAVRRVADEFKAGVRYFDLHIGGSSSVVSGMLDEGILDMRLGQATRRERRQGIACRSKSFSSRESVGREARKIREPAQKFAPALLKSV